VDGSLVYNPYRLSMLLPAAAWGSPLPGFLETTRPGKWQVAF
jgi:hypothetical protein